MKTIALILSILLLAYQAEIAALAAEPLSKDKVKSVIEQANILGASYQVEVGLQGNEAIISTYRHKDSLDQDNDCKIDATLIAKELMIAHDLGIRRVRVHFHEPRLVGDFREIIVTYPAVKAFAAGAVTQEEFLSSLDLNRLPEQVDARVSSSSQTATLAPPGLSAGQSDGKVSTDCPANPTRVATALPGNSGNGTGTTRPASGAAAAESRRTYVSRMSGISFAIPSSWTVNDKFDGESPVFKLETNLVKYGEIELSILRTKKTPQALAVEKHAEFSYSGVNFERYNSTNFGRGQYPGALIVLSYPHEDSEKYYDMHLYFKDPSRPGIVYDLWGWCPVPGYRAVGGAFFDLLTTLTLPQRTTAPAQARRPQAKRPGGKGATR